MQHVLTRREHKKASARLRAQTLMARMRTEAEHGHTHLAMAKQEATTRGPAWGRPHTQQHSTGELGWASCQLFSTAQDIGYENAAQCMAMQHCTTSI